MTVTLCVIAAKSCSTISLWTGSKKLLDSQVLIIGLGGLGTPGCAVPGGRWRRDAGTGR